MHIEGMSAHKDSETWYVGVGVWSKEWCTNSSGFKRYGNAARCH